MNNKESKFDDQRCPICGNLNRCSVESQECWCFHTNVPQGLIDQIPVEVRGKACICRNCIESINK